MTLARKKQLTGGDTGSNQDNIHPPFAQAMNALREIYLGPGEAQPGKPGKLVDETRQCETSTKAAILQADPTEKRPALLSGFNRWQDKLCKLADECYQECFQLATRHQARLDSPAVDVARSFAIRWFSEFLGVAIFDGAETPPISTNRRTYWFVRHACGDYSDEYPGRRPEQMPPFQLPFWFSFHWRTQARFAKRHSQINGYTIQAGTPLSITETAENICEKERELINDLRDAIAHAVRIGQVQFGKAGASEPEQLLQEFGSKTKNAAARRGRPKNYLVTIRRKVMQEADEMGLEGKAYCEKLDERGLSTPVEWQKEGCPKKYPDAYNAPRQREKWRQRIADEKYKATTRQNTASSL